jgi:hypothetical protein
MGGHIALEKFAHEYVQGPAFPNEKASPYSEFRDGLDRERMVIPDWVRDELMRELRKIYRREANERAADKKKV